MWPQYVNQHTVVFIVMLLITHSVQQHDVDATRHTHHTQKASSPHMSTKFFPHNNPWFNNNEPIEVDGLTGLTQRAQGVHTITLAVDATHMRHKKKRYAAVALICEELELEAHAIVNDDMRIQAELAGIYLALEMVSHIIAPQAPDVKTVIIVTDQTFVASIWGGSAIATKRSNTQPHIAMLRDKRNHLADTLPKMNVLIADTLSHSRHEHSGHRQADQLSRTRLREFFDTLAQYKTKTETETKTATMTAAPAPAVTATPAALPPQPASIFTIYTSTTPQTSDTILVTCILSDTTKSKHSLRVSNHEAHNFIQALTSYMGPIDPVLSNQHNHNQRKSGTPALHEHSAIFARITDNREIKIPSYALNIVINQMRRQMQLVQQPSSTPSSKE